MQRKLDELASKPGAYEIAVDQTLKREILDHLATVAAFIAKRDKDFYPVARSLSTQEYSKRREAFMRETSALYVTTYYPKTRALLERARERKHLPQYQTFDPDPRVVDAGMIQGSVI